MAILYTKQKLANKLPSVEIGGIKFPIFKKAQYSLKPNKKISYILVGASYYKKEELQARSISVGVNDLVQGDLSSLSAGDVVSVNDKIANVSFQGIVTNFSASSISVKEVL